MIPRATPERHRKEKGKKKRNSRGRVQIHSFLVPIYEQLLEIRYINVVVHNIDTVLLSGRSGQGL